MPIQPLSKDMEAMSHSGRVRRAVGLGRASRNDPRAAKTLAEWRGGGFTQRLLAVYACYGSGDGATLVASAADDSRIVSRTALAALRTVGEDHHVLAALLNLPRRTASKALPWLRKNRPAAVGQFVRELAVSGEDAAWPLVALAGDETRNAFAPAAEERGGESFWTRLAPLHPGEAAERMVVRLTATETPDGLLFGHARSLVGVLANRHPKDALQVVLALVRHTPLTTITLQTLARRLPVEVASLVLASPETARVDFGKVAPLLGHDRIVALVRRNPGLMGDAAGWLGELPSVEREAAYRVLNAAWTSSDGTVPVQILRRLPGELRATEARRMIGNAALATRPMVRLTYAALLPWEEAREHCAAWVGHPEAEYRSAALVALCEATRFDRPRLGDLLELLTARRHEQDPVRSAFLAAVASLPPGRWMAEHVPALARLVRDALDASDLSGASLSALGRFLLAVLPFHPEWAAAQLAVVTAERGFPANRGSDSFSLKEVAWIAPALNPVIRSWVGHEKESALVALGTAVGRRLPLWPELADAIEATAFRSAHAYYAASAMGLVVAHLRDRRDRVVAKALAADGSWALRTEVLNYLNAHRQDLLTPYLGHRAYAGRFGTGNVRQIPPVHSGFQRWTPTQQETFASCLEELAAPPRNAEADRTTGDALSAILRLAVLPAVAPERLVALARDERAAVKEAAVRALGRLDARQGIPELLDALADARARFAIYGLRGALVDMAPGRVLSVLRAAPLSKVTVAKEAVRLAGELGGSECLGWFAEIATTPLHRDVRGAMLRALWDHLERPEAWAVLDPASTDPDPGVVIGLSRIPVARASSAARERVASLLLRLLGHAEPTVRMAVLQRLTEQPVPDPPRRLLAAALAALHAANPDERTAGMRAALALAGDADADRFDAAISGLLPKRKELSEACTSFADRTRPLGNRLVAVRSAVLAAVERDPACGLLQVRLAAARLAMGPFAEWVRRQAGHGHWHVASLAAVANVVSGSDEPAEDLERAEATWAGSEDSGLRWLAVRALVRAASRDGWTRDRRARLEGYRLDTSPVVGEEAVFTFPPDEG